ncbi:MAG: YqgE/AlgH family protein [Gammaproteobacteria bacterium]
MGVYTSLRNHFLIAMPSMADVNFYRSVIYICEHTPEGAMGIIINLPLKVELGDVLKNLSIEASSERIAHLPVLAGGPIQQDRGFVLHRPTLQKWQSSLKLNDQLSITTSKDILASIAHNDGPTDHLIALGYAGWSAGQLEIEFQENAWLCAPLSPEIIFEIPCEQRWRAAAAMLGVEIDFMTKEVGHA